MMKPRLLILIGWLLSFHCIAESSKYQERKRINFFAELTYNSNSINTKQSESTTSAKTTSTFSSLELGADYFLWQRMALTGQFLIVFGSDTDAEITGFDLGSSYYPLQKGYQSEVISQNTKIHLTPKYSPFLLGGFSSRSYQFSSSSLKFQGFEFGAGADYHLQQNYFVRGSASYQMLQNTSKRTFDGFALGLSVGYAF